VLVRVAQIGNAQSAVQEHGMWQYPNVWFFLWIIPAIAAVLIYAHRKRSAASKRFVDRRMADRLMPTAAGLRPWVKGTVLLLGITCLLLAAARPRWGVYFEEISARGVDLFVVLDVSRSMLAEDLAPNRLGRAKSDILDLLNKLQGDRVGLITFAGAAVVHVPLTTDQGFFRSVLADVDSDSAPLGGTLIGDAIRKAIESMEERRDRDQVIVLITDGEDHDSFPEEAAALAAERGIKIITVGLGDTGEGARIPVRDEGGNVSYARHEGQEIWSVMDERLLKEIAMATEGAYVPARTRAYDLGQIYEDHLAGLTRGEIHTEKRKRYGEQFQVFVCLGLGLLLLEMAIPGYARRGPSPQNLGDDDR
jgi:Ca-activated chloride channel family protein